MSCAVQFRSRFRAVQLPTPPNSCVALSCNNKHGRRSPALAMSSTPKTPGGTRRAGNPQASAAAVSAAGAAAPAQVPHPPQLQQQHAALAALGGALLDAFPAWTEQHAAPDKEDKAAAAGAHLREMRLCRGGSAPEAPTQHLNCTCRSPKA